MASESLVGEDILKFQSPWAKTPPSTDRGCIRILRLHRGSANTPITCDLQVADLDNDPHFEALSYVWGEPSNSRPIEVSGSTFYATVNLHDFLLCLRLESADRYLWADALCIDQSNQEEKSYQIGLMTRIYRDAKETHIWFGPFCAETFTRDSSYNVGYKSASILVPEDWDVVERYCSNRLKYFSNQKGFRALTVEEHQQFATACENNLFSHTLEFLDKIAKSKEHLYTYPVYVLTNQKDGGKIYKANRSWLMVLDCIRWLLTRPWWGRVWSKRSYTNSTSSIYLCLIPDTQLYRKPFCRMLTQLCTHLHNLSSYLS